MAEIEAVVPLDWLDHHREEYIELCEKIMKTIIMAEAANKGWQKPPKSMADIEAFIEIEAKDRDFPAEQVRQYLLDAGKIKARNQLFEKHYLPMLPKNSKGECRVSREVILKFIHHTTQGQTTSIRD